MTKSDKIKIPNNKIKANNVQYDIDRLNAKISAFSEGDLDKYEFLTRKDLKHTLDKAKFEFSALGKGFNQGLDKKGENYKEEGVIKLLKDIRDRMVRPIGGHNDDNENDNDDNDDNDDNGDNDEISETGSIDLSWMNNLQLYRQIVSEVFTRYNRDKDSLELFTLRTSIDNINNESVKNKKDAGEEFKTVKKNVKSEALKQIVKDLEQAIFGYDDDKSKELEEAEELDRRFNKLRNKKILEAEELERKFENLKNRRLIKERIDALRKKLNNSDVNVDNDMILNNLLSNLNIITEIAEKIGKYF